MNIVQIEENVKHLIHKIAQDELNKQDFIYELLLAYGHRSQTIGRVRNGERNLAEDKENTVFWKRQIYFKIAKQHDLHGLIDQMKCEKRTESNKIRFLIVTDFKTLLAVDTKIQDTLDVPFNDLAKKFDFFLPWAGMEKAVYQGENPADVKAAEKLAKLFDEIKADNFDEDDLNNKENLHHLNIFLSRLLFCYFAEDTEIFKDKQFTSAISKSNEDGLDLSALIGRLFKVLNRSSEDREADLPDYLADFPYVNGGLFKDDIQVPKFTRKSRRILIECGAELDWSDINPDIFGSMFQAVVHTEQRSTMGQHYTSVPNIMKVIEPLFLNDLYEELEKNQDSVNKLLKLQQRLGQLKIFDPACGSGNFLIIAYKELRKFEMELLKRIQELELEKTGQFSKPFSVIQVSQFYGIEVDDFAHEIAILSLWLAEHQMNSSFKVEFGEVVPSLPLKQSGNIICANSNRIDWNSICPNSINSEIYLLGNPPYLGQRNHTDLQREDMEIVFRNQNDYKNLDYIACWFYKASQYIHSTQKIAFVTTNSICQGSQVSMLWPKLFQLGVKISFCYKPFKWKNNARDIAGVTVTIIGLSKSEEENKYIYLDSLKTKVDKINAYLVDGPETIIESQNKSLFGLPKMLGGNQPREGGYLCLTNEEKLELELQYPQSKKFLKRLIGTNELIKGTLRWCLWIEDQDVDSANQIPPIKDRIEQVRIKRLNGNTVEKNFVNMPHRFVQVNRAKTSQIVIPNVSTPRRDYIPIGFLDAESIITNLAMIIPDGDLVTFGLINSHMHMVWVKAVSGRLGDAIRYTVGLSYNTFPIPKLTSLDKDKISSLTINILQERENYPNYSLEKLYDPDVMPDSLKQAHLELDNFIEEKYSKSPLSDDFERLSLMMKMYKGKAFA
ncbi:MULTISPECIES: DNA methyltransferase [Acinetobacter]|nr:DNA methyltransferase [Acinetobacter oleivorans]